MLKISKEIALIFRIGIRKVTKRSWRLDFLFECFKNRCPFATAFYIIYSHHVYYLSSKFIIFIYFISQFTIKIHKTEILFVRFNNIAL